MKALTPQKLYNLKASAEKLGYGEKDGTVISVYLAQKKVEKKIKEFCPPGTTVDGFNKAIDAVIDFSSRPFAYQVFNYLLQFVPEYQYYELFSTKHGRTYILTLFNKAKKEHWDSKRANNKKATIPEFTTREKEETKKSKSTRHAEFISVYCGSNS